MRNSNHDKQLTVRAKKLAEFLSTAEAEEVLLTQRLRDAQGKEVWLFGICYAKYEFIYPRTLINKGLYCF